MQLSQNKVAIKPSCPPDDDKDGPC